MSALECPSCGSAVPVEARFCAECGSPNPVAEGVETRLRKYWSAPDLGLLAGIVLGAAGVVLIGAQAWLWAALALAAAAAVFLFRWETGRRRTGAALARLSAHRRIVGARSRGQLELFRLRRELAELQAECSRCYQELGRATHAADEHASRAAVAQVDDVCARVAGKEEEIAELVLDMEERVRRAQAEVTPTQHVGEAVPEPYPPPDEGTPPEPARVPEPFPQPVPEPSPDDPPPQPEPPPPPESKRRRRSRAPNA